MTSLAEPVQQLAAALIVGGLVIAGLVLGQVVLLPLAAAIIVAFMLAPIVRWIAQRGAPQGLAVGAVLVVAITVIAGLTYVLSVEMLSLTARLDDYRGNIVEKVRVVAAVGRDGGILEQASIAVDRLGKSIAREIETSRAAGMPPPEQQAPVVVTEQSGPFDHFAPFSAPAMGTGLTLLFTIFLLLQYQDLRDRVVRILGTDHLSETTGAMTEAGTRLSRLFLTQALINTIYGVIVGTVLGIAGVPGALAWGALAALMRFVPFIGSFIAALPPVLLAAGVESGWGLAVFTLLFFTAGELLMGNLVDPLLLGRRAGLSPFAMIAAASFWTLVWGPIGLLLAAPLTMVLVVVGRHLPGLQFISVLLGDEPALSPEQLLYHRLLSGDVLAVAERIEAGVEADGLASTSDDIVLPALRLAANDVRLGRLGREQTAGIKTTLEEALELAPEFSRRVHDGDDEPTAGVLVIPVRGDLDIAAAHYLALAIEARCARPATPFVRATGLTAIASARLEKQKIGAVVIVTVAEFPAGQLRYMARRAGEKFAGADILLRAPFQSASGALQKSEDGLRVPPSTTELLAALDNGTASDGAPAEVCAPAATGAPRSTGNLDLA